MPKNPKWSIGKSKRGSVNSDIYYETFPTFIEVKYDTSIQLPPCQGSLNDEKVKEMVNEYRKSPINFLYKDTIIIGVLNEKAYLMDGQHRIEMAKRLVDQYSNTDKNIVEGTFRFCYRIVNNENELRSLFNSVNQDSIKNSFYLDQDNFTQIKMDEFTSYLNKHYRSHFAKQRVTDNQRCQYTLAEFRDQLQLINFFNNNKSVLELLDNLRQLNEKYLAFYKTNINNNPSIFYKKDFDQINKKIVFTLVRNNFLEWMNDTENIEFCHKYKGHKTSINRQLRLKCWDNRYSTTKQSCPIPNCGFIMEKQVTKFWEAGHIISEKNGGQCVLDNLRPICKPCNGSMGPTNWEDYINAIN